MTTRNCTQCGKEKDLEFFHKDRGCKYGRYPKCKECRKAISHTDYNNRKEYISECIKAYRRTENGKKSRLTESRRASKKDPVKFYAQRCLSKRFKSGTLKKRNSCEICYDTPTQCHHENYSKPFEFIELCKRCHVILHKQYKKAGIIIPST